MKRVFSLFLVVDVQVRQLGPCCSKSTKVRGKWNARQLPPQIGGILLTVLRVMQKGVNVVKYVPLGDAAIVIMREVPSKSV